MDPSLVLGWLSLFFVAAVAMVLWLAGLLLDVRSDTRFRLISAAVTLSWLVAGARLGFSLATILLAMAVWFYAAVVGLGRKFIGV